MIYPWINFAILFLGLAFILKRGLGGHFKKQRDDLDQKMKSAGEEYELVKREFDETRKAMNSLQTKISEMHATTVKEIQIGTKKIENESEQFIQKLIADGDLKMKAEIVEMKQNLERDLMAQALAAAKETLEREFKTKDADWTSNMLQQESSVGEKRKNYAS
jgi:F0F1-type ATP synthase membrane subunit b/b'